MSDLTRYEVIAGLEQKLHEMMTRPGGFMYDKAEYAIVQAAAEITGLTASMAAGLSWREPDSLFRMEHEQWAAVRRYAELAK